MYRCGMCDEKANEFSEDYKVTKLGVLLVIPIITCKCACGHKFLPIEEEDKLDYEISKRVSKIIIAEYIDSPYKNFNIYWAKTYKEWQENLKRDYDNVVEVLKEGGYIKKASSVRSFE